LLWDGDGTDKYVPWTTLVMGILTKGRYVCERIYTFKDIFEQHVAVWLFTGVSISYKQQCLFDLQFKRGG